jgi:hypothetical protein
MMKSKEQGFTYKQIGELPSFSAKNWFSELIMEF